MSRIHEALERAGRERNPAENAKGAVLGQPFVAPAPEQNLLTQRAVDLDKVSTCSWSPSMLSLPTLNDRGESVEQFRSLRSRVYEFHLQKPLKTIVVSSGVPGEGKTFVAANLAISLARNKNHDVLLIDADMRRPALHGLLGAPAGPGLSEYFTGAADIAEIIQRHVSPETDASQMVPGLMNLFFISAGQNSGSSAEFLSSNRFEDMLSALSAQFTWIIIDSPPALAFADAIDLARAADSVLLVARGASTPHDVAQRAQAAFGGSRILGFVLNAVKNLPHAGSYYYYDNKR
jgi:protein-tyrosine kinase